MGEIQLLSQSGLEITQEEELLQEFPTQDEIENLAIRLINVNQKVFLENNEVWMIQFNGSKVVLVFREVTLPQISLDHGFSFDSKKLIQKGFAEKLEEDVKLAIKKLIIRVRIFDLGDLGIFTIEKGEFEKLVEFVKGKTLDQICEVLQIDFLVEGKQFSLKSKSLIDGQDLSFHITRKIERKNPMNINYKDWLRIQRSLFERIIKLNSSLESI